MPTLDLPSRQDAPGAARAKASDPEPRCVSRRAFVQACLGGLFVLSNHSLAHAEAPTAPIPVQARILARTLPFDRTFASRAGSSILVVVAELDNDADSSSAAKQMDKALADIGEIASKPVRVETVRFSNAATFVAECIKRGALASYLTPGLSGHVPNVARALVGSPVLTLAAVESYVPLGAVLGVEVLSGKPRISINLGQAKSQGLDFPSALLKLAKVYR